MVISEELRIALYPLGFLSLLAFTLRFLIQWIQSEKAHRSKVSSSFWWLSLVGNISLLIHSLIQGQYFICLVQGINGVIAVRNLNLMHKKEQQWALTTVLVSFFSVAFAITFLFYFFSNGSWFRTPIHQFQTQAISPSYVWHLIGFLGVLLFASRFWIQWLQAERSHHSTLERSFWWVSLAGAFLSILYFAFIQDYINLVGPLFGLIPYCRNLVLLKRAYHA